MIDTKVGDLVRWTYRSKSYVALVIRSDVLLTMLCWLHDGFTESMDNYDAHGEEYKGKWEVVSESR